MRVKILLLFAICHLPFAIFGQISEEIDRINSDSFLKVLTQLEGTEKIDTLNKIALSLAKDSPDSCRKLATRTISMSDSLDYKKGLAEGYRNRGVSYIWADSLFPAMIDFLSAVRIYEQIDPSIELANIYVVLSWMNNFTGRFKSAIIYEQKAVDVYKQINNNEEKADRYHSIARAYMWLEEYDTAIYYNELAVSNADSAIQPYLYNTFGTIFLIQFYKSHDTSLLDRSVERFVMGLNLPVINDNQLAVLNSNLFHAYNAYGNKKTDRLAMYHANMAISSAAKSKETFYMIPSYWQKRGKLMERVGKNDSAVFYYNKSLEIIDSALSNYLMTSYPDGYSALSNRHWLKKHKSSTYYNLYYVHTATGDYKKALEYYVSYKNASEDIYREDTKNLIALLEAESENEKKQNQISLLAKANENKDLRINHSKIFIYGLVGLLAILFFVGILYLRQRRIRMAIKEQALLHDMELKRIESDKLKDLDKMKSRFFTNISHEFRTPLTLILGPLEDLKKQFSNAEQSKDLEMIQRNAFRLQNLIDQLLELSKLESGKMQLQASEEDIVILTKSYCQSFESLAKQRHINYEFNSSDEARMVFLDQDKFEKILYNLISNAFKFTEDGGSIIVSLRYFDKDKQVKINVSDTGQGIPQDHMEYIFDRFYQAGDDSHYQQQGSGIGLALVKEIVALHHGEIGAESEIGKGSTFTVSLPTGKDHLKEEEILQKNAETEKDQDPLTIQGREGSHQDIIDEQENELATLQTEAVADDQRAVILIVEDNADMRYYIRSNMPYDFQLIEAVNGVQGLEKAIESVPDLIISDVMMPEMDGIEMSRQLKNDERTCHIPIILLTAKAAKEDRLEGLETGADDFLTKPFDQQELLIRIRNLIKQRRTLQEIFTNNATHLGVSKILDLPRYGLSSMDQDFLIKATQVVTDHISDEDFNAESLHDELSMSYLQLYRKLKSLVGQSVSEFIRTVRLSRAAEMLKAGSHTVTEIAYAVGFNNLSYFSKSFEQHFGVLPSQYKETLNH